MEEVKARLEDKLELPNARYIHEEIPTFLSGVAIRFPPC